MQPNNERAVHTLVNGDNFTKYALRVSLASVGFFSGVWLVIHKCLQTQASHEKTHRREAFYVQL